MTADEVASVLAYVKRIRPNLFKNIEDEETYAILEQWQTALAKYHIREVGSLVNAGYYFQHYNYTDKVLVNLVKALDDQRNEKSEKAKALERYRKACEKMPKPVPQTEHKPLFDCVNCADKDKQYCGGGICMKMLGGAR